MDWDHTIMSYESGGDACGHLGTFDIQAIQFLYGDAAVYGREGSEELTARFTGKANFGVLVTGDRLVAADFVL